VGKEVYSTAPPGWNGLSSPSAQAIPLMGLVASLELDTIDTGSPVCGTGGNHLNDATGGGGGGVTVNVTGPLLPVGLPYELSWSAAAVYCPTGSAGLAGPDVHPAPVPVAVDAETIVPFVVAPAWISTLTGVVSLAVPVKDGVVSHGAELGEFSVTAGGEVITVNVTELAPPAWLASAV
jgi:hypothetical protein